jgi:hypothetical protein
MNSKMKYFDCVKMKNDIQAKIYSEINGLSSDEILAYFNSQRELKQQVLTNNLINRVMA